MQRPHPIFNSPYLVPFQVTDAFTELGEHPMSLRQDAFSFRKPTGINPMNLVNIGLVVRRENRIAGKKLGVMGQGVSE